MKQPVIAWEQKKGADTAYQRPFALSLLTCLLAQCIFAAQSIAFTGYLHNCIQKGGGQHWDVAHLGRQHIWTQFRPEAMKHFYYEIVSGAVF